uniref:Uncharacterized protein n=1 Tax=Acrobeloides nanus TaxID=290746 RepID=A0A914DCB1_9BILA
MFHQPFDDKKVTMSCPVQHRLAIIVYSINISFSMFHQPLDNIPFILLSCPVQHRPAIFVYSINISFSMFYQPLDDIPFIHLSCTVKRQLIKIVFNINISAMLHQTLNNIQVTPCSS